MRGIAIILLGIACGAQSPTAPPTTRPVAERAPQPARVDPPEVEPAQDPAPARVRIVLDLARHPERASLWFEHTEVIQLGSIAGARHSLGAWSTSVERRELGGDEVLATRGRQGRIPFFVARAGATRIALEGRTVHAGPVQIFVDDERVHEGALPTRGWGSIEVEVPELAIGEHELLVRGRGSSTVEGGRVGVALRSLEIGPAAPAIPADVGVSADRVQLAAGWKIRVPFVVPEAARLLGEVRATTRIRAIGDSGVTELGEHTAGPLDVDLSELAGRATYLELEGGSVANPVVVRPVDEEANEAARPRNVLMVLVDTLRADRLSPYNPSTRVQTPGLSAFVESASTFAHAHAQENWTKPSVATLLSGLMPWEHTATGQSSVVPRSVELLPEVLQQQGFATASFISNGYVSDRFGFRQGWDTYRNYLREGRRNRAENVAADVLGWLDQRTAQQPFFAYVHTIDPHVPYRPPERFLELYGDSNYRGPVDFRLDSTLLENVKLGRVRLGPRDREHLQALYDGEITYHDVHFRSILDGLQRRGLADDTLVVVTSDHGEEFWDHGSVGHGHSVYEELLHVPLFVKLPGTPARRVEASVGLVDVMPTILEALGVEPPEEMSGRSFLAELRGAGGDAPRASVSGFMENWRTVTDSRFKLIVRPRRAARLYDLENDPGETDDLAERSPWTVRYLREQLAIRLDATRARERTSRRRHRATRTRIDDETAAQLRAIGYVVD